MIHFAAPWFLLLLPAVPLLGLLHLRRRGPAVPHPALGLFAGLPVGRSRLARHGPLALRLAGLSCLAVALAQPRWPDLRTRLDTDGIAVMMVLDVSGSMAERDFDWGGEPLSRLDAVRRVFRLFVAGSGSGVRLPDGRAPRLEGRPADLIGLVSFGSRPEVTCPLTLSHSALLRLLDAEEPRGLPGESETNLSDAMALGLARLKAAGTRRKVVVLLTDGEHNQAAPRSGWSPRQTAQLANSLGVPVYAIDAGGHAAATLQEMAALTGGRYFAARDGAALLDACAAVDRLERTRIAGIQYRRYHEGYPWLGLASFVCFVTALALEPTPVAATALTTSAFAHPYLLAALAALPLLGILAALAAQRRRRGLLLMAGLAGGAALVRLRPSRLRGGCVWLGLTCLAVGMAGPRWGRDWSQSAAPGRDVVLVLDLSRSMFAEAPSRLERARAALLDLADTLRLRGGHRVALIVFAGQARTACPLTHDLDHFRDVIAALDPDSPDPVLGSGTRLGSALVLAAQTHDGRSGRARDVLLLSDGDDPARDGEWRRGIEAARAEGVRVTCVGLGDAEHGHRVPDGRSWLTHDGKEVRSRLESSVLGEIARRTGGELILAGGRAVPLGQRYLGLTAGSGDEDSPDRTPAYRQRQGWFLLPALVLLSLALLIPDPGGAR